MEENVNLISLRSQPSGFTQLPLDQEEQWGTSGTSTPMLARASQHHRVPISVDISCGEDPTH
eukprot:9260853-Ditylum_brightwellii.AAC.1